MTLIMFGGPTALLIWAIRIVWKARFLGATAIDEDDEPWNSHV